MIKTLLQKQKRLEEMLSIVESRLKNPAVGRLEVVNRNGKTEYYKCNGPNKQSARTRKYIKCSDIDEARKLAQTTYDKKALKIISGQLAAVKEFLFNWDEERLKALYEQMSAERRELINPLEIDDKTYAAIWQSKRYDPGEFAPGLPELYSYKGERVRSKSEKIVADELCRFEVPYHYEYPLFLDDTTVRPDFYALNVRTRKAYIIELFGMMDDPEYARKNVWKLNQYTKEGYVLGKNLLVLHETSTLPVDMAAFRVLINHHLK